MGGWGKTYDVYGDILAIANNAANNVDDTYADAVNDVDAFAAAFCRLRCRLLPPSLPNIFYVCGLIALTERTMTSSLSGTPRHLLVLRCQSQ